MKKLLKKNQVIIYVIAIMFMTAGYLNYTINQDGTLETSMQMEAKDDTALADIGDATLVSSNDILGGDTTETNTVNSTENELNSNTTSIDNQNMSTNETEQANTTVSSNKDDYFTKSKLERDTMYSQMIETYEKVLNSSNSLETQKQTATQEITKINETKNSIMICENLIKTKGFENCIVFVNGESVNVIIGVSEMKQEEVAQIQNIVSRELKSAIENIHISTK
jgi:stage III sporulation protein AH